MGKGRSLYRPWLRCGQKDARERDVVMNSELGKAIRGRMVQARLAAGLSQEFVGARLTVPVSRQAVSKWETGKGAPTAREFIEYCLIVGSTPNWIGAGMENGSTGSALVDKLLKPADFADSSK